MANIFNSLPKELYPDCWSDENRINVLFAPFRNKSVNSKDGDSKHEFWRNVVKSYCLYFKQSFFRVEDLQKAFAKHGRIPACLPDVIREMHINGDLKEVTDFTNIPAETWILWAADLIIKKPIIWSFNKLKKSVINRNDVGFNYIHVEVLEKVATELSKSAPGENCKSKIVDIKTVNEFSRHQVENVNILLNYLLINHKCSLKYLNTGDSQITLVKFSETGEKITEHEVDIYTLECSERTISSSIGKFETDIQSIVADAKKHLLKGHRQLAKSCLKKKKELEKRVNALSNALFNIQTLLLRLEDTEDNGIVIDTYKKALNSLRTTFKNENLNEDAVANTMLELSEVLDIHDDIQATLSQPVHEEDADLEAELADLLAADSDGKSSKPSKSQSVHSDDDDIIEQLKNLNLPELPTHSPLGHLSSQLN